MDSESAGIPLTAGHKLDMFVPQRGRVVSYRPGAEAAVITAKAYTWPVAEDTWDWVALPAIIEDGWVRVRTPVDTQIRLEAL